VKSLNLPSSKHPLVRLLRVELRRLGASTPLAIACSGGADSSALAIIAAAAKRPAILLHIQHDLRSADLVQQDAAAVQSLAQHLALPVKIIPISVPRTGNLEAAARKARYTALAKACTELGLTTLATAHHAGDQYESVLAATVSGGGLAALSGIAPRRWLQRPHRDAPHLPLLLVRPLLTASPSDLRAFCTAAGWSWQDDHTNHDTTRLRSAIRTIVLPAITATGRSPQGQYAATAAIARQVRAALVQQRRVIDQHLATLATPPRREQFTPLSRDLQASLLRAWLIKSLPEIAKRDLGPKRLDPIINAINDHHTHPRQWPIPLRACDVKNSSSNCTLRLTASTLEFVRTLNS
jgi:tRNA(Ile)-lysidine synthetase-like protein